ncbi:hypothetical protein E0L13_06115 [Megasphaera sp. SW808]|uniref:hypothetical protein n=1 Tax=Megasphaera sp. SW808 TaxID=2530045 RepID=UPI00143B1C36|nr:hypothetical protein [Megasphaera sp. SW808]NJE34588.1 hypothetical protein [Megasphaera sp. SW808]
MNKSLPLIIIASLLFFSTPIVSNAYDWKRDTWDRSSPNAFVKWHNEVYGVQPNERPPENYTPEERIDEVIAYAVSMDETQGKTIMSNHNAIKELQEDNKKLKTQVKFLIVCIVIIIIVIIGGFTWVLSRNRK